ncbi:MAG TPA: hypothetical protein VK970_09115, partial [Candidatus Methylacidiphilales bacterium]|nr:hypothetical protein [Candidatus Methylacidiphilales bacterium]
MDFSIQRILPRIRILFSASLMLGAAAPATELRADVKLHALFSDHAVLQKSDNVPVWGTADPGEPVMVSLGTAMASTTAGPDGKWRVKLDLSAPSFGSTPLELVVKGKNELRVQDVITGEVWLCGGQSNMEYPISSFPVAKEEVPNSANPLLRQFKVKLHTSPVPVDDVEGKWVLAGPNTSGSFSATGYFYGKKIQKELGVPIGLLNDCLGGTGIEGWMSPEAMDADPDLKAGRDKTQADRAATDSFLPAYAAWMKKHNREDRPTPAAKLDSYTGAAVDTADADWKPVTLPGLFSSAGLPDAGAIWLRRKITVPTEDVVPGKEINLYLGDIRDSNEVYWNGKRVGVSTITATDHHYTIG